MKFFALSLAALAALAGCAAEPPVHRVGAQGFGPPTATRGTATSLGSFRATNMVPSSSSSGVSSSEAGFAQGWRSFHGN